MSEPTVRAVHFDRPLTNISVMFKNPSYISDQIFPEVPVQKQSDLVPKYDQSAWFRDEAGERAPGTTSSRSGYGISSDNYFCRQYSHGVEVPDQVRDNADAPFDVDRDAAMLATEKILLKREGSFAAAHFKTGEWGADKTTSDFTVWSNYSASIPLVNIEDYREEIEGKIGTPPNTMTVGSQVWTKLKWHPDLIDTIKQVQRGIITPEVFRELTDGMEILIGRALRATSAKGLAESALTLGRIWGKHALLTYKPASPGLMQPSAGYTFVWNRVPGAKQYIKRMRNEEREITIIEGNGNWDQKKVAEQAGIFLSGVVA